MDRTIGCPVQLQFDRADFTATIGRLCRNANRRQTAVQAPFRSAKMTLCFCYTSATRYVEAKYIPSRQTLDSGPSFRCHRLDSVWDGVRPDEAVDGSGRCRSRRRGEGPPAITSTFFLRISRPTTASSLIQRVFQPRTIAATVTTRPISNGASPHTRTPTALPGTCAMWTC